MTTETVIYCPSCSSSYMKCRQWHRTGDGACCERCAHTPEDVLADADADVR